MLDLSKYTGFDWDSGNLLKNLGKHQVTREECEEVFINNPRVIIQDLKHSQVEARFTLLGITRQRRQLTVVFTIRGDKIRIISARNQKRGRERTLFQKEKEIYGQT